MSTTPDFDLVVQELSKNMYSLDSAVAKATPFPRDYLLSEFRTIKLGAGREQGLGTWAVKKFIGHPGKTLMLCANQGVSTDFIEEIKFAGGEDALKRGLVLHNDYPDHVRFHKFDQVIIISAGYYFNRYKHSKIYKLLAECVTDDIIIYHLN